MSEQTLELKVGDHLIRNEGGGFAEVTSIEYDATSNAKHPPVFGYHIAITEPDKSPREALIRVVDLPGFLTKWHINGKPLTEAVALDTELTATATVIADLREQVKQLRERNTHLEARNAELNESLESAVDHDAAAADRNIEVVAQLHTENDKLTEQLAEARAKLASLTSSTPAVPAANPTVAPVREFKIIWDILEADLCKMERENWQIQHMEFVRGDKRAELNVVYFRYVTPVTAAPEPLHASVKAVGPVVTIIPETRTRPRFNADEYMAEVLEAANQAAQDAVIDAPVFTPPSFQLSATVTKPEVRRG